MIFNQVVAGMEPQVSPPKFGTLATQPSKAASFNIVVHETTEFDSS